MFWINFRVFISQILIVLSSEPDIIYFPSGEKFTLLIDIVCPFISRLFHIFLQVFLSQIIIFLSQEHDTMLLPSGEKFTE